MTTYSPTDVARRLDAWRTGQDGFHLAAFDAGLLPITFADGLTIAATGKPGELVLNGRIYYSSVWL